MAIGKMLGGSSGSNIMYYARGDKTDFDRLSGLGVEGWDWDNATYYYKKSERMKSEAILNSKSAHRHNTKGYFGVTRPEWGEKSTKYLNAFKEIGHKINVDNNEVPLLGYSQPCFTIDNHIRQNTAIAFLTPIKDRPNLRILKGTYCRRIIFDDNKKAVGVEVRLRDKSIMRLNANIEIILSAGAIQSPRILMTSGIGPKEHLIENNVKVVSDSPNVGQNLQDHVSALVSIRGEKNLLSIPQNIEVVSNLDTFPSPAIMGYANVNKSDPNLPPDYQNLGFPLPAGAILPLVICSHVFQLEDNICEALSSAGLNSETLDVLIVMLHPESRGEILLKSDDPEEVAIVKLGYFTNDNDLEKHALYIEDYLTVLNTTYFLKSKAELVDLDIKQCNHLTFLSHEYWKCYIRNVAQTLWHFVGTTAMGPRETGVVDSRLKVWGVTNLRVIDAGSMPRIISGNTNAVAIMIGEKGSDMIKEDHGIPIAYEPY